MSAEKRVQKAMDAAAAMPPSRLSIERRPDSSAVTGEHITVRVQNEGSLDYVLLQPQERNACCTCPDAVQGHACKHQIKALQMLFPHPRSAQTILWMLGTRFGAADGCSFSDVSALGTALANLCGEHDLVADGTLEVAELPLPDPDVHEQQGDAAEADHQAPRPEDPAAAQRHAMRAEVSATDQLATLLGLVRNLQSDPAMQRRAERLVAASLQQGINAVLALRPQAVNTATALPDFQQNIGTFSLVRLRSCVEGPAKKRTKPAGAADRAAIEDFRSAGPQRELGISNAWKGVGGAAGATRRIADIMGNQSENTAPAAAVPPPASSQRAGEYTQASMQICAGPTLASTRTYSTSAGGSVLGVSEVARSAVSLAAPAGLMSQVQAEMLAQGWHNARTPAAMPVHPLEPRAGWGLPHGGASSTALMASIRADLAGHHARVQPTMSVEHAAAARQHALQQLAQGARQYFASQSNM